MLVQHTYYRGPFRAIVFARQLIMSLIGILARNKQYGPFFFAIMKLEEWHLTFGGKHFSHILTSVPVLLIILILYLIICLSLESLFSNIRPKNTKSDQNFLKKLEI